MGSRAAATFPHLIEGLLLEPDPFEAITVAIAVDVDDFDAVTEIAREDPVPDELLIGHTLDGRYRIERLIGRGTSAAVYAAEQLNIRRQVAVKVLAPSGSIDEGELYDRFEAEVQIIAHLTHPNTVSLFDHGRTRDGRPYFVTELLAGRSLQDTLCEGPLSQREVLEIIRQVGRSLAEAHELGVVHRDLKPANIFLDRTGDHLAVKILDFGLAKASGFIQRAKKLTAAGALVGTPVYMSPEQCVGQPADAQSDLYSLGVIAYQCLTGQVPFEGPTASVLRQHVFSAPEPLYTFVSDLDPRLESLVMSLLAKRPEERPASASAVVSSLSWLTAS